MASRRVGKGGGSKKGRDGKFVSEERGQSEAGRLDGCAKDATKREKQELEQLKKALAASEHAHARDSQQHQQELAELRKTVRMLQSARGVSEAQLAEQFTINQIDKQMYADDLAAKEADKAELQSQNLQLLAKLNGFEEHASTKASEWADCKEFISFLQSSNAAAHAKLFELCAIIDILEKELQESADKLAATEADNAKLQSDNLQLLAQLKSKTQNDAQTKGSLKRKQTLDSERSSKAACRADTPELLKAKQQLTQQLKKLQDVLAEKEAENTKLRSQLTGLQNKAAAQKGISLKCQRTTAGQTAPQATCLAEVCKLPEGQEQLKQQLQGTHDKLAAKETARNNMEQPYKAVTGCDPVAAAQAALRPVAVFSRCSITNESQPAEPGTPELSELSCPSSSYSSSHLWSASSSPSSSYGRRNPDVRQCVTRPVHTRRMPNTLPWVVAALQQRGQCC